MFIKIGKDSYIQSDEIEYICSTLSSDSKKITEAAKANNSLILCTAGKRKLSIIKTKNGTVYVSPISILTLKKKIFGDSDDADT